jgi:hypothetical protein
MHKKWGRDKSQRFWLTSRKLVKIYVFTNNRKSMQPPPKLLGMSISAKIIIN